MAGCAGAGGCHGPRIAPFPTDVEWRLFTTVGGAETRTTYLTGADGTSKDSSVTTGSERHCRTEHQLLELGKSGSISKGGHLSTAQMATSPKSGRSPKSSTAAVAEGSSNTSSATRLAEEGVKVSRQELNPLAKSTQTGPDGSSIQSRSVRKSNEREVPRPSPDSSSVRTGAPPVSTADERGRPLPSKTVKPTETKRGPHRSVVSTPSSAKTTERSDPNISVRSPERSQAAPVPQSPTAVGGTASNRTDPNIGRRAQKIVRPGSHRAGQSHVGRSHQPPSWTIAERKTEALPTWRPGATRPGWETDPWSQESSTPRWQLDPWQPPPWEAVGSRPHRAILQPLKYLVRRPRNGGLVPRKRWWQRRQNGDNRFEIQGTPVQDLLRPLWERPEVGKGRVALWSQGSPDWCSSRDERPVLLKVPGGVVGTGGPPPRFRIGFTSSRPVSGCFRKGLGTCDWISQKDSNVGWRIRTNLSTTSGGTSARTRGRQGNQDRLQRVERTKVSTQNTGSRLTQAEKRTLPEAHYPRRETKTVVKLVPGQIRDNLPVVRRNLCSLISKGLSVSHKRLRQKRRR